MERKIERSRVGGLKVLEGGACLVASFPQDEGRLAERVCTPLALNRINLSFFTHMASDREVLCTASRSGEAAFTLLRTQAGPEAAVHLQPGTAILSLYPHDQRPEIIGNFILSLAQARVMVHGLGSSVPLDALKPWRFKIYQDLGLLPFWRGNFSSFSCFSFS